MNMTIEHYKNDNYKKKLTYSERVCSSSPSSFSNVTLTALRWNPVLLSRRLVTKRLTRDTLRQQFGIRYYMQLYVTFKTNLLTHQDNPTSGMF